MANLFISHASSDKPFIRMLAHDLAAKGHEVWLDEWEVKVGESIPLKIEQGITQADFVLLGLSENSVKSNWVEREWRSKFWDQINENKTMVLPMLIEKCTIPKLLNGIKYANFAKSYSTGLGELLDALGHATGKPAPAIDPLGGRVAKLLAKIHAQQVPLSACIAEGIELAREIGNADLEKFCREELEGAYPEGKKDKDFGEQHKWRIVEAYILMDGELNPGFIGFQTEQMMWRYILNSPEEFRPIRFVYNHELARIEQKVRDVTLNTTALTMSQQENGRSSTIYLRPKAAIDVINAVRSQFVQRLLALMPMLEPKSKSEPKANEPPKAG
jgi:hypothetical protein